MIFDSNHNYSISSEASKISASVLSSTPPPESVQASVAQHNHHKIAPSLRITSSADVLDEKLNELSQLQAEVESNNLSNKENTPTKLRNRSHPNIHHHPTIRPHYHYQRTKMPENCKETIKSETEKSLTPKPSESVEKAANCETPVITQKSTHNFDEEVVSKFIFHP